MPKLFVVMIQLLRQEKNGENSMGMVGTVFHTREDAQAYIDETRRQNLPMKARWIFELDDPRATGE